jgi:CRP-like cAMP-binding protein
MSHFPLSGPRAAAPPAASAADALPTYRPFTRRAPAVVGDDPHRDATKNRLLSALRPDDFAWLEPHLERVTLASGQVLAEPRVPLANVYFPETAVLSLVNRMADGSAVEVGTVGSEGMAGVPAFLGAEAGESQILCQIPGAALRAPAAVITAAGDARPDLRHLLNRYTQAYLTQVAQTAACNRVHAIEQRCARWLLATHDRVGGAAGFALKQEFLAVMLGVRRAGVSVAAGALQDAGLIRYRRGGVRVLDRVGLERAACECYGIVRRHFDRLLPCVDRERAGSTETH